MFDYNFFISRDGLRQIHETALRILADLGLWTGHAGMRERLAGQGCRIEGERVFMPPDLVETVLRRVPAGFTVYGRTPEQAATLASPPAGGRTRFTNTGILPNICDFETGAVRRSTLDDVRLTTRLMDALGNVDVVYVSLVDATELPAEIVTLADFSATLANTTKPLVGPGVTSGAEAEAIISMAAAARGSKEALRQYPACVPFICPITPLRFPADLVDALVAVAEAGLPLEIITNPVMGVTSPYTIASTVALGHAEMLASIVMAHAVQPGLPILNANTPSVADMHTLGSTTGGPETGLIRRAVIELSHFLGMPACAHGHTSSARLDFQAGDEKGPNELLIASARPALLGGMGGLANVTLASYELLLLDDERNGSIRRILEGVTVDEDHLAFAAIASVAASGEILGHEHTLRYLHGAEVWRPRLAQRQGLVNGAPSPQTSVERAHAAAARIMATHHVQPLSDGVQSELDNIVAEYGARGMPEAIGKV